MKNPAKKNHPFTAVVIGVSAGGLGALQAILPRLPGHFPVPVMVVQHLGAESDDFLARHLNERCALRVKEAEEKELAEAGTVYIAPANYHLLVEDDGSFSLSIESRVNFARPSIDILFETASEVYGQGLIGVILTGANNDGSQGLAAIKNRGGLAIVQDPTTAEVAAMPRAAIAATSVDFVLPLAAIGPFLANLCTDEGPNTRLTATSQALHPKL